MSLRSVFFGVLIFLLGLLLGYFLGPYQNGRYKLISGYRIDGRTGEIVPMGEVIRKSQWVPPEFRKSGFDPTKEYEVVPTFDPDAYLKSKTPPLPDGFEIEKR